MARVDLDYGVRWGRLVCTEVGIEWKSDIREEFGGDIARQCKYYELRCDCGREFRVWKSGFPGKRKMRDCGCGLADEDGVNVFVKWRIPSAILMRLGEFPNVNRAAVDALRRGLGMDVEG